MFSVLSVKVALLYTVLFGYTSTPFRGGNQKGAVPIRFITVKPEYKNTKRSYGTKKLSSSDVTYNTSRWDVL